MKTKRTVSLFIVLILALPLSACSIPKTKTFTIKAGALVEVMYINATGAKSKVAKKILPDYARALSQNGGELLASFEVTQLPQTERKMTHIVLIQWNDPSKRAKLVATSSSKKLLDTVGKENIQYGFFGAQQDTSVNLHPDKIYDFTSAWFISEDPCTFPTLFQVLGGYFQNIDPITAEYGISQTAFFGPHPAMPHEANLFVPHMFGIFEWQKYEDREVFNNDPKYTAHVDVRNAVLKKMDVVFAKLIQ